ncbi:MAG: ACP S-malonyltransferase [Dermatophilaceae bacterium]
MIAIVCPGQGSQTPGFLTPWLELPGVPEHLAALSESAGVDLATHGTTSDQETITDTAVAQPLLVGAGLIALRTLAAAIQDDAPAPPAAAASAAAFLAPPGTAVLAGHSVGEVTACAAAGVLGEPDAMALVALRGRAMAEASAATPTGMSAVLGGDPDEVLAAIERHGLTPANVNSAGQVVAAGALDALAALAAEPPERTRVIPLTVAGAFHTGYMEPAVGALRAIWGDREVPGPAVPVLSNRDGEVVASGPELLERLITQVSSPVRWDLCAEQLARLGVTAVIELPPAGTLVGLAKRTMPGVARLALRTPDDLEAARGLFKEHSA